MASTNENGRLEMFSDGVFAIAITLLVLEIKVPPLDTIHSVSDLWQGLRKLGPSYFAFALSFLFIFIAWGNHHVTFRLVDKSSSFFIYANGFLLLTLVFLPFPTALLATYIRTEYAQPAAVFYCFSYILQNIGWNLLYESILNRTALLKPSISISKVKGLRKNARFGFIVFLSTTFLAWWFPLTAITINTSLFLLWIKMSRVEH
ncbi:MAG: TMEM175 family protein [Candidatus Paceibacterales bacterium]